MLVIGEKEQAAGSVAVRARSEGDRGVKPVGEFIEAIEREIAQRSLTATV